MRISDSTERKGPAIFDMTERVVNLVGNLSGWIYFSVGAVITYEVVMRYFFNAPTSWVEEISRLGMVWATFLIFASCLAERHMITITLVKAQLSERWKMLLEAVTFAGIAFLSCVLLAYSIQMTAEALLVGRHTATPLGVPYWAFYLPLCLGFLLLLVQSLAETLFILVMRCRRKPDPEDQM